MKRVSLLVCLLWSLAHGETATGCKSDQSEQHNYAVLISSRACRLKTFPGAFAFVHNHADDYPDLEVAYAGGTPRIRVYSTKAERDMAVTDSSTLTVDSLQALLERGGAPAAEPLAELTLEGLTVEEIHDFLANSSLVRTFPKHIFFS